MSTAPTSTRTPAPSAAVPTRTTRVYVWDLVVRSTHWTIAAAIVILGVTGYYIGHPFVIASGPAGDRFVMGWMRIVHNYAAMAFSLAVLARLVWMFMQRGHANWRQLVPWQRQRRRDLWETIKFYALVRKHPPAHAGHNPLAGSVYALVFLLYLAMMATGLALYSIDRTSYMRVFSFLLPLLGEAQQVRWLHHVGMWVLGVFLILHLYTATLVSRVEKNGTLESIFSGYKFVAADEPAAASGPALPITTETRKEKPTGERHAA